MSAPQHQDEILDRFAELSLGAAAYCHEVGEAYTKFMATGDRAGWDAYCHELAALKTPPAAPA